MAIPPAYDASAFIRENLRLTSVPSVPQIRLHTAHPESGLGRLGPRLDTPYWAYPWAGGIALARFLLDRPAVVAGRRVLDLGCGSGLVAIAAAKAGAATVAAVDVDPFAIAALGLNAEANSVQVEATRVDLLDGPAPEVDLVLVGDLFYERRLASRVAGFLERCLAASIDVLVGDPGRAPLPRTKLVQLADYAAPDVGDSGSDGKSAVYAFLPGAAVS